MTPELTTCHDFRKRAFESGLDRRSIPEPPSFREHAANCAACRDWLESERQLDSLISAWAGELPRIDLADSILNARLQSVSPASVPQKLRFSRRRLGLLVGTLAASLLLILSRIPDTRSPSFIDQFAQSTDPTESAPVESIVSSLRNVVEQTQLPSGSSFALMRSESLLPDLQVGSLELQATTTPALSSTGWTEVRRELQPLESEVKQALDFIWSALPEDES